MSLYRCLLRCTIGKEPRLLQKYLDSCLSVAQPSQEAVQHTISCKCSDNSHQHLPRLCLGRGSQLAAHATDTLTCRGRLHELKKYHRHRAGRRSGSASCQRQRHAARRTCVDFVRTAVASFAKPGIASVRKEHLPETFSNFVAASVAAQAGLGSDWSLALAAATRLDARHASRVAHNHLRSH